MQVIIPLTSENYNNNIELKYALRSFDKFLSNVDQIYIIGHKPDWITNVVHVPFKDRPGLVNKESNIYRKIKCACEHPDIKDDFLFCNDDQYLLKPFNAETFPYHFHGTLYQTLHTRWMRDPYLYSVIYTQKLLIGNHKDTKDFDGHSPLIYNKHKFINLLSQLNWDHPYSFIIKSLYCNLVEISGLQITDVKFRRPGEKIEIFKALKGAPYFSTDDRVMNEDMVTVLNSLYKKKSKYEL